MSIKINNFMGKFGWNMRKYFPRFSSEAYLKLQFKARAKSQKAYIDFFNGSSEPPHPLIVNLETINRCNSTCEFCAASRDNEKRPLCRMTDELFYSIIESAIFKLAVLNQDSLAETRQILKLTIDSLVAD